MVWIKRHLYFLIGSLIALILMVLCGFMLFSNISKEEQIADQINKQYNELLRLTKLTPNPGSPGTIDNVKAAHDQETEIRAYIAKVRPFFERITPIPNSGTNRISNADFAAQLRITIADLHHDAEQQGVLLPKDYYFTFEAQKKIMNFEPASLSTLALHLGEIKVIAELLFEAKINSLDSIRRESISANDNNPSDYIPLKTVSTLLADRTPYELSFRCFSSELALVLANLANSRDGFVVKAVNIEPAAPTEAALGAAAGAPAATMPTVGPSGFDSRRYPGRPGPMVANTPSVTTPVSSKNGTIVLTEKPFRVTLLLDVIKLKAGVK